MKQRPEQTVRSPKPTSCQPGRRNQRLTVRHGPFCHFGKFVALVSEDVAIVPVDVNIVQEEGKGTIEVPAVEQKKGGENRIEEKTSCSPRTQPPWIDEAR